MEFKINSQAKIDIQEQIHYYNQRQKGLGMRFHNDVKSTFNKIQKNPFYQIRYKNIRCLPLNKFPSMVHYTFDEVNMIIIVRAVTHTSLDSGEWKKD